MDTVLNLGASPSDIVFANPCKFKSHLEHAAKRHISLVVFDNKTELLKIARHHQGSHLLLRIKTDDRGAALPLSDKFGAPISETHELLKTARELGLNVVGVAFHVGSGCCDPLAFRKAISLASLVWKIGKEYSFPMEILDIGGGFPGTWATPLFSAMAREIKQALHDFFPPSAGLPTVIAEPGTFFVQTAFTLVTRVIAKRSIIGDTGQESLMYYLNDGVYGSFSPFTANSFPRCIASQKMAFDEPKISTLWGPTCSSLDCIGRNIELPEVNTGDILAFPNMGAYTQVMRTKFNGFHSTPYENVVIDGRITNL